LLMRELNNSSYDLAPTLPLATFCRASYRRMLGKTREALALGRW